MSDTTTAPVPSTGKRTAATRRSATVPQRAPEFAQLSLDGLRSYRATLTSEEHRVSYWRRLLHARIDLARAVDSGAEPSVAALGRFFNSRRATLEGRISDGDRPGRRTSLSEVGDVGDLPSLPDLAPLWNREPVPGDSVGNAELLCALTKAEEQLSAYRTALHLRLAAATGELVARYHEDPSQCLSALPLQARPGARPGVPLR